MHRISIGFLLVVIAFQGFTQGRKPQVQSQFGVFYSFDQVSGGDIQLSENRGYTTDFNQSNYRAGIAFEQSLSKNLMFTTGFNYTNAYFEQTYYCDVCNFFAPIKPEVSEIQFLEAPLGLKYYFTFQKLKTLKSIKPFLEAGAVAQYALDDKLITTRFGASGKAGGGVSLALSRKLSFQLSANYIQQLTPMFEDSNFKLTTLSFKAQLNLLLSNSNWPN